jgi:hypothetical protein
MPASRHAVIVALPLHYPLTQADEIAIEIRRRQASLAAERKLGEFVPELTKHQKWMQIFLVQHWERIIRSRYSLARRKGAISSLEAAFAAGLNCSHDSVAMLRKPITRSRTARL